MTEVGASWGNRGAPFSFFPKGALTHHLVAASSISLAYPKRQVSLIPLLLLSP